MTDSVKVDDLASQGEDDGSKSNILSLPSNATDDVIQFSDIPIMKVTFEDEGRIHRIPDTSKLKDQWEDESKTHKVPNTSKPQGSAYISIKMSIGTSHELREADLCVDTGADFTVCDSAFLTRNFGPDALKHLRHETHYFTKCKNWTKNA